MHKKTANLTKGGFVLFNNNILLFVVEMVF